MQITEHTSAFEITFAPDYFFKRNLAEVKKVKGIRWNPLHKIWTAPISARAEVEYLKISCKATMQKAEQQAPETTGIIKELPPLTVPLELKENTILWPYQQSGIQRMIDTKRCMNGDEPGLGKTIQTIAALSNLKRFPAVVICPASLKLNWAAEIRKFSHLRAMILQDKIKRNWIKYFESGLIDVFIVNYESLAKYFVASMPETTKLKLAKNIIPRAEWSKVQAVIIDESHRLKNPGTKQTKIALRLCHNKEVVFMLTGTPVVNRPIDLYPQLAIMGRLEQFGGRAGFLKRYCDGGQGATNLRELNYYLNLACYFGRKKKEVLKDLPDKQRQTFICEISTRAEYDFAKKQFVEWMKSVGCDDAAIRRKLRGEILVKMNVLRQISARGKIDAVIEYVDEIIAAGEKVVLFCTLTEIIKKIKNHYPQAVSIDGSISESQRDYNKNAFQNNPACNIIICNIKAGGVGLTLTASSRVGFIEFPWTWADCIQCEDRTHRIGQKESVMCTYFFGEKTIDERIYNIIQDKKTISDAVTGGSDEIEMGMVDKIVNLFTE